MSEPEAAGYDGDHTKMRKFILPAILALSTAAAPMAFAATKTEGTVKSYDAKTMMVTLDDGAQYKLPKTHKMELKPGEKVAIEWTMMKNVHEASKVTVMK